MNIRVCLTFAALQIAMVAACQTQTVPPTPSAGTASLTDAGATKDAQSTPVTASGLIGKMFARYFTALSVSGTIRMTQAANGRAVITDTELQYVRPNKVYLHQIQRSSTPKEALLCSDGKLFSYDRPEGMSLGRPRFVEYTRNQYVLLDIGDMFTAAVKSIPDPNRILEVAIGRKGDLKDFVQELAKFHLNGMIKLDGEDVYSIVGDWHSNPKEPISGSFEIDITPDGDFRRYKLRRAYGIPNQPNAAPVIVDTVWEGKLTVGGNIDPSLFKVVP